MSNTDKTRDQILYHAGLTSLSPLDGREVLFTERLRAYLSESGLHLYRAKIQIENLIALSESGLQNFPVVTQEEKQLLRSLIKIDFNACHIADYDHFGRLGIGPLEHDVKGVETYLRERFEANNLGHLMEFIHYPMTSEDANNLSWNLGLRASVNYAWLPKILETCDKLASFAEINAAVPVLGKTHGMNASTTTFGKRFAYFLGRFTNVLLQMKNLRLSGKFSGPVGNHNAMVAVAPEFDIESYAKKFVESFGFVYEPAENQRNSHIEIVRLFNEINLINVIGADLCENIRHGVMMGWLSQVGKDTHVGSSVMPHKINPWFFEVAQGYFEKSIALIHVSQTGLIPSVFERDLTDHPWERSYGEMIGYSLVGLSYISDGLDTLRINDEHALAELQVTPEILSEAVQIAGRLYGSPNIYMTIKNLSRGRAITRELLHEIIDEHITDNDMRIKLKQLSPETYTGRAADITHGVVKKYKTERPSIMHGFLHPMSGIELMLFDLDNTIQTGDKDELHARLCAISKNMNLGFTDEQILEFGRRSDYKEMRRLMVEAYNGCHDPELVITEEQFEKENDKVSGTFDHYFRLFDGAKEVLDRLVFLGCKRALVTTRGKKSLTRLLASHGIADCFDVIISRDDAKERKPHPQPIAIALEKLGIPAAHAMFVGDNQVDDIIAGNALGLQTMLVSPHPLHPYGAIPNYHFANMQEVLKFLSM